MQYLFIKKYQVEAYNTSVSFVINKFPHPIESHPNQPVIVITILV